MSFNNAIKKVLGLGDYGEGVDDLDYFETTMTHGTRMKKTRRAKTALRIRILNHSLNKALSSRNLPILVLNCHDRRLT